MLNETLSNYVIPNLTIAQKNSSVFEVYELMKKNQIRHIPIVENGSAVGIISDRDLQFLTLGNQDDQITCGDLMTIEPYSVAQDMTISSVSNEMARRRINCALIHNEAKKIVGIYTSSDALEVLGKLGHKED